MEETALILLRIKEDLLAKLVSLPLKKFDAINELLTLIDQALLHAADKDINSYGIVLANFIKLGKITPNQVIPSKQWNHLLDVTQHALLPQFSKAE